MAEQTNEYWKINLDAFGNEHIYSELNSEKFAKQNEQRYAPSCDSAYTSTVTEIHRDYVKKSTLYAVIIAAVVACIVSATISGLAVYFATNGTKHLTAEPSAINRTEDGVTETQRRSTETMGPYTTTAGLTSKKAENGVTETQTRSTETMGPYTATTAGLTSTSTENGVTETQTKSTEIMGPYTTPTAALTSTTTENGVTETQTPAVTVSSSSSSRMPSWTDGDFITSTVSTTTSFWETTVVDDSCWRGDQCSACDPAYVGSVNGLPLCCQQCEKSGLALGGSDVCRCLHNGR